MCPYNIDLSLQQQLLLLLSLLLLLPATTTGEYKKTEYLVRPRALNRRGIIGPGRVCPKNTVAIGFKIKVNAF